jgi:cytochrome c
MKTKIRYISYFAGSTGNMRCLKAAYRQVNMNKGKRKALAVVLRLAGKKNGTGNDLRKTTGVLVGLVMLGCTAQPGNPVTGNEKAPAASKNWPASFGFGRTADAREIAALDIAVRPDGKGLPAGEGRVPEGRQLYAVKCAACHGVTGREGPYAVLVGAMGDTTKAKTIGNYWPYATTVFDYIRRAMPYNAPGSLTSEEVYHITAFLLYANRITDSAMVINAQTLPRITMPAAKLFVPDDRRGGHEVR